MSGFIRRAVQIEPHTIKAVTIYKYMFDQEYISYLLSEYCLKVFYAL